MKINVVTYPIDQGDGSVNILLLQNMEQAEALDQHFDEIGESYFSESTRERSLKVPLLTDAKDDVFHVELGSSEISHLLSTSYRDKFTFYEKEKCPLCECDIQKVKDAYGHSYVLDIEFGNYTHPEYCVYKQEQLKKSKG